MLKTISDKLRQHIDRDDLPDFQRTLIVENITNGRTLAMASIVTETILVAIALASVLLQADKRFLYGFYLFMYLLMITWDCAFLLFTMPFIRPRMLDERALRKANMAVLLNVVFIILWGGAISIIDQKLYPQVSAFMVNMLLCCVLFRFPKKNSYLITFLPGAFFLCGLPFAQKSQDVLIGHYVNLGFFLFACFIAARLLMNSQYRDFKGKRLLEQVNRLLMEQIEENKRVNAELEKANGQLKQLALCDELTGIPNRRSLRNFFEAALDSLPQDARLCAIMADIDNFKVYNDRHGHHYGDVLLARVAKQIEAQIDPEKGLLVRWGGDEFLFVSFRLGQQESLDLAQRIRDNVLKMGIACQRPDSQELTTLSAGVCTLPIKEKCDIERCIALADRALYLAKSCGRNCVKMCPEQYMWQQ